MNHEGRLSDPVELLNARLVRAPILRLWGHVVVPVQGDFRDDEAEALCASILEHVEQYGARSLIVDISGIWLVDSHFCSVVVRIARGARLMGASTVLSGLSPEIAATIETMGLELDIDRTARNLEEALEWVGIAAVETSAPPDPLTALAHLFGAPTELAKEPGALAKE